MTENSILDYKNEMKEKIAGRKQDTFHVYSWFSDIYLFERTQHGDFVTLSKMSFPWEKEDFLFCEKLSR